jgi:hemerythrin
MHAAQKAFYNEDTMSEHTKIAWDNNYKIGIDAIDQQHKKLFVLVNKLYDLEDEGDFKQELKQILYDFSDYMKTHFKDEEAYMESIGYPALSEHKKYHENIIETLAELIRTPAKIGIIKTKMKVIAKKALVEHITKEDIKIKLYALSLRQEKQKIDEEIFEIVSV